MNILVTTAAVQGPLLGLVLVASSAAKIRMGRDGLSETAFAKLLERWRLTRGAGRMWAMWLTVTCVEVVLGCLLLASAVPRVVGSVAAGFFLLAASYVAWALRYESGSSCGCFTARVPASWTSAVRAACLSVAGAAYAWADTPAWRMSRPTSGVAPVVAAIAAELLVLFALSSEVRREAALYVLAVGRLARARGRGKSALAFAVAQVRVETSRFWSEYVLAASAGEAPRVVDSWHADGWTYNEYATSWYGEAAAIVTAVRDDGLNPTWRLTATLEAGASGSIVAAFDSETEKKRSVSSRRQTLSPLPSDPLAAGQA